MERVRVGLIGAGKHGQRYAAHIRTDVPELTLTALCRRDAVRGREQAEAFGCRFHDDWRALVDDPAVEALIAAVPPSQNRAIVAAAVAARKPLLLEKPLATSGADAIAIVRALRGAALPCLMAHTLRWNAIVRALRERLPALGALRALFLNQRFEPSVLDWLDDPAVSGGGIVLHTGVHSFDLVRWLTGREVVHAWCQVARVDTQRTEDNFTAVLALEGSDALVTVNGSRSTRGRSGLIDAASADGQLVGDHALGFLYGIRGTERTALPVPEPVPTVREALRAFARLLLNGEEPLVEVEDGARAVLIAEACLRSAASGGVEPVVVPPPA
jgi:predicted dehydrogenase